MRKKINTLPLLVILNLVQGQLNYNGDPLTESTEYTAVESQRISRQEQSSWRPQNNLQSMNAPQKLYPILEKSNDWNAIDTKSRTNDPTVELALKNFLNSKTPEESESSLNYYLSNAQRSGGMLLDGNQIIQSRLSTVSPTRLVVDRGQPLQPGASFVTTPTYDRQASSSSSSPFFNGEENVVDQASQFGGFWKYPGYVVPAWPYRTRRVSGRPFNQPRISPPVGMYKTKGPVELIYTRPPKTTGNVWSANSKKNAYWSQLYAQSYDPRYYNYIARTGKIKPWLYGRMGEGDKPAQQSDNSMWMELVRGFTKHGLKNIMTPGFLIGMSIPAITLMLTALVQQRSLARSSNDFSLRENDLREYTDNLRRAIKCYEKNQLKIDDC